MIVTETAGHLHLDDASNFRALVFVTSQPRRTDISDISWVDDDHVLIAAPKLRELAGPSADEPTWTKSFDAMIAYATSKGWVDDAGNVRMHVEPPIS